MRGLFIGVVILAASVTSAATAGSSAHQPTWSSSNLTAPEQFRTAYGAPTSYHGQATGHAAAPAFCDPSWTRAKLRRLNCPVAPPQPAKASNAS
jgi:hypothetical protein